MCTSAGAKKKLFEIQILKTLLLVQIGRSYRYIVAGIRLASLTRDDCHNYSEKHRRLL